MSDVVSQSTLISYFREYGPKRFQSAAGKPLGRRALQKKIHEFNLPVIVTGKGDPLIDEAAGDDQLRRHARSTNRAPRGRGRPRRQ
jgi:hypothetical protein